MPCFSGSKPRFVLNQSARAGALLLAVLMSACSANKNQAQRQRAAEAAEEEAKSLDAGLPDACVRSCLPDPGSLPVDCAKAEEGIEFAPPATAIEDFELASPTSYWGYSYHDGSDSDPNRDVVLGDRCGNNPDNHVLHIQGGPFAGWGGGLGLSIKDWWSHIGGGAPACEANGLPFPCENKALTSSANGLEGRTVDARQWDGISLWARRGPEGQDGVRVTLGDKYTDDELNIDQSATFKNDDGELDSSLDDGIDTEQTFCKRARICSCHSNHPCTAYRPTPDADPVYLCYDPKFDPPISTTTDTDGKYTFLGFSTRTVVQYCGQSACNDRFPAGGEDYVFRNKACTPFVFQTGDNASYCFDPGKDPNPPENYERCGDHWQTPVRLSTDWQLFLIPFSDMRQQGYGKEAQKLHVDELSLFRVTWEGGFLDLYIDDVRFYRVKR
jgi:hypothetical protein